MKNTLLTLWVFVLVLSCGGASEDPIDTDYNLNIPSNFPEVKFHFSTNSPTRYGVELGKKLFYDGRLARDNATACAFCHIQENAFTHHGHSVSHGVDGLEGFRNAPPIQNMIFLETYMWDGSVTQLEHQPIIPISSEVEMDETIGNIVEKLKQDDEYRQLFKRVYGNSEINADRILNAITQFVATMISADSKYDKVVRNEGEVFTTDEQAGKLLFEDKCASCHQTDIFTDHSYRNTGIPYSPIHQDIGRKRVTGLDSDYLKFRVPSLRNVEYTAPYMHDGRFYSLKAVLDFYDENVEDNPNLDPLFKQNGEIGIKMTEDEKLKIIAFLKTLSDENFISNPAFAE